MDAKAPRSHICSGSVCCAAGGGEREGIAAVEEGKGVAVDAIMAERGETVVEATAARGDQPEIDTEAASGRRAAGLHVPGSLPPSPLRGRWDRAGAQYEEARKLRLAQVFAARGPTENGSMRAPASSIRHVTGITAPTRAPASAPVAHRLARLASYQWRNAVDHSIIAGTTAPSVARDEMEKIESCNEN